MSRRPSKPRDTTPLLLPSQQKRTAAARTAATGDNAMRHAPNPARRGLSDASAGDRKTGTYSAAADGRKINTNAAATGGKTVYIDGSHALPSGSQTAHSGSTINLPLGNGVNLIAWHPCGLYVLDKPEGVLSHPNKKAEINRSLLHAPYSLEEECFYNLGENNQSAPRRSAKQSTSAAPADRDTNSTPEAAPPCTTPEEPPAGDKDPTQQNAADSVPQKLYLLHRLDSATSGLLLLADNETLANDIRAAFASGGVRKTYLALCMATAAAMRPGQKGRWSDRLQREHSGAGGSIVSVRASSSGMSAVTDFVCRKTAARNHSIALLELHPISGRTHQLRVHCAQHNLPIIGDAKYGDFRLNRALAKETGNKRLFLHAAALALDFTHKGKPLRMQFTSQQPAEFDHLLNNAPELSCPAPQRLSRSICGRQGDSASGKQRGANNSKKRPGRR